MPNNQVIPIPMSEAVREGEASDAGHSRPPLPRNSAHQGSTTQDISNTEDSELSSEESRAEADDTEHPGGSLRLFEFADARKSFEDRVGSRQIVMVEEGLSSGSESGEEYGFEI